VRVDGVNSHHAQCGRHLLQHLYHRLFTAMPDNDPAQTALLQQLGVPWRPRLAQLRNADWEFRVSAPLIQPGEVSPWAALEPNYIAALLEERRIDALIGNRPDPETTDRIISLLQMLLRHAQLREIATAAALLFAADTGSDPTALLRDAELVDLVASAAHTALAPPAGHTLVSSGRRSGRFWRARPVSLSLRSPHSGVSRRAWATGPRREALLLLMQGARSVGTSAGCLDHLGRGEASGRNASQWSAGQYVGAYGWVENLRPAPAGLVQTVSTLPRDEPGPLQTFSNDSGFIHAPSMSHAAAAALLRNSQLGPQGVPTNDGPFAIDLSSRRVREATRLLDGVRQGQPLGALLGYRLERALHDTVLPDALHLDRFIAPLRRLAPLVARANESNASTPTEMIAANNVVDGLVLNRRWKEEQSTVLNALAALVPPPSATEVAAVSRALNDLNESIDGLSDALTAETAYQVARGNMSRVASTLSSIAHGDAPPPQLDVARTPRSGIALTHRLITLMSGTTNLATPGWPNADSGVRSSAEKQLNHWAAKLLGDGSKVRCTLEGVDTSGAVVDTRALPLRTRTRAARRRVRRRGCEQRYSGRDVAQRC
jgi:hypothetical protein